MQSHRERSIPVAPASNNASACTSPNPRAAPDTSTTLSARLNSGSRLLVPVYVGAGLSWERAAGSVDGGEGGARVEAWERGREEVNVRVRRGVLMRVARVVCARRGRVRSVVFILLL